MRFFDPRPTKATSGTGRCGAAAVLAKVAGATFLAPATPPPMLADDDSRAFLAPPPFFLAGARTYSHRRNPRSDSCGGRVCRARGRRGTRRWTRWHSTITLSPSITASAGMEEVDAISQCVTLIFLIRRSYRLFLFSTSGGSNSRPFTGFGPPQAVRLRSCARRLCIPARRRRQPSARLPIQFGCCRHHTVLPHSHMCTSRVHVPLSSWSFEEEWQASASCHS